MAVRKEADASGSVAPGSLSQLVEGLRDPDAVRREAAVARLRVAGARALPALARVIGGDPLGQTRAAAVAALEGSDDARALALARRALDDADQAVALAAVAALRPWIEHDEGVDAVEALTVLALDRRRDDAIRLAALDALSDLPPHLVAPIRDTSALQPGDAPTDEPSRAHEWLAAHSERAALTALHDLIAVSRDAERAAPSDNRRQEWLRVRGAAHVALARRGSRLAVYDLRETFDASEAPLPIDFLAAVTRVGDDSCLEPLARAWERTSAEPWWRTRLEEAAADIIARLGLSGRHAAVKRLRHKWPGLGAASRRPGGDRAAGGGPP